MVGESAGEQTTQTLRNIEAVLDAGDADLDDVVKSTVFLIHMGNYEPVNDAYAEYLSSYPARSAVEVSALPIEIEVELEDTDPLEHLDGDCHVQVAST